MGIIITIIGLFGIPSLYFGIKSVLFKQNIEFHKLLQSFPLISDNRINGGIKTTTNDNFTKKQISKELTDFVDSKKGELDEFLARLEKFDVSKLKFKKKEITYFINNIKRLLMSKSSNIQIELSLEFKPSRVTTKTSSKSFEWCASNYSMVSGVMDDQKQVNKLFICKMLNF